MGIAEDSLNIFDKYSTLLDRLDTIRSRGKIISIRGLLIESHGPICQIGEVCDVEFPDGRTAALEVIGFNEKSVQMTPLENIIGLVPGLRIFSRGAPLSVMVGEKLMGRILNGLGEPIDSANLSFFQAKISIFNDPPDVLKRKVIKEKMNVGVKAIDGMLTVGRGQRIGIFSGPGVGKSTLLSMIAKSKTSDVNVIALIGERGREVRDFIENSLGEEGMKKSIVVVSSSDDPPMARVRCAYTATRIAEYFRESGKDVLLMMDSVTRLAMAQREISSSLGEPPTSRGYTPSVFTMLPRILERAANSEKGTITGFYNVLVEGGDLDEPVSDAIMGILDGHIILSRDLANRNHYPAIDVSRSISRLMPDICSSNHLGAAGKIKELVSAYNEVVDLINIGAYISGSNPKVDDAITLMPAIDAFLKQGISDERPVEETLFELYSIVYGKSKASELIRSELGKEIGEKEKSTLSSVLSSKHNTLVGGA